MFIDFFHHLLNMFQFTKKVYPINISDHVLMFTDVHGNNVSREWQFNASLLEDNELKDHLEAQWSLYLETNSEHAENPSSFWYYAKTFLKVANTAQNSGSKWEKSLSFVTFNVKEKNIFNFLKFPDLSFPDWKWNKRIHHLT